MRSRHLPSLCWIFLIVFAMILGLASLEKGYARNQRFKDVCHFDEGTMEWRLIRAGEFADVNDYLDHLSHDDTFPPGTTLQTGVNLDAQCRRISIFTDCPCLVFGGWNPVDDSEKFDSSELRIGTGSAIQLTGTFFPGFNDELKHVRTLVIDARAGPGATEPGAACFTIGSLEDPNAIVGSLGVSPSEFIACRELLLTLALNDGISCP